MIKLNLSVLFEEPFWIGICERTFENKLDVCKITFGAEPKIYEIYDFIIKNWYNLSFSPQISSNLTTEKKINPKRMQRTILKQIKNTSVSTKSQQALKLQQEQSKAERKINRHKKKELEKERQFLIRQQKKKNKHKGK